MLKEEKHHHYLSPHNIFWYGLISASIIFSTGLHKKIFPHPIINEKAIYLLENDKEEVYCDMRESELPWRFTKSIECKTMISGSDKVTKILLDDYTNITNAGK